MCLFYMTPCALSLCFLFILKLLSHLHYLDIEASRLLFGQVVFIQLTGVSVLCHLEQFEFYLTTTRARLLVRSVRLKIVTNRVKAPNLTQIFVLT